MKKILALGLIILLGCTSCANVTNVLEDKDSLRGVWVASVYNIDFPTRSGLSVEGMQKELDEIVDKVAEIKGNAIFFQVRPTADALYNSSLAPYSAWLTGVQGEKPSADFDPLAYLITKAKAKDIGVHAWINPYKVTRGSVDKPNYDLSKLSDDNVLKNRTDLLIFCDGEVYMDPSKEECRRIVLDVVKELVQNYDIAGIHYDDYFYPQGEFADDLSYEEYGGSLSIDDWRRENVNLLIKDTYDTVKSINSSVQFGVSPAGIWANKSANMPQGSDTFGGSETYYNHYADSVRWVKEGWVDYIAPQIYWNIGYEGSDYAVLLKWWSDVCKDSKVKLYVGQALYKLGDDSQSKAWLSSDEIANQLKLNQDFEVDGSIFYGYSKLKENYLGIVDVLKNN